MSLKLFVVILDYDQLLWEQFLQHYMKIGVTDFYVVTRAKISNPFNNVQIFDKYNPEDTIRITDHSCKTELRKKFCAADEWHIVVDLDEFIEFDKPIDEIIKEADVQQCDAVRAFMLDRMSKDGLLPETSTNIWEQYSVICKFSYEILKAYSFKTVLIKGHLESYMKAYSRMTDQKLFKRDMKIHHFKWRKGIVERLFRRYQMQKISKMPWRTEHAIFLRYWYKNKRLFMPLSDLNNNVIFY